MMRLGKPIAYAVSGLVLVAAGSGCTGGTVSPTPSTTPGPVQSGGGGISPADLPTPPALSDPQGAVADVKVGDCATAAGTQQVTGTVTNSARATADYVITINWTNDTYDVAGRGIAVVKNVKSGATQDWKLSAKVGGGATRCTPNVLRGQLRS